MKLHWMIIGLALFIMGCKQNTEKKENEESESVEVEEVVINDEVLETAVIYEANIRQYSPEGTFNAFTADIPKLKELGVKVIWLMPIHPISMVKRKAESELSIEDIEDPEERKQYLGSYYAVADYTAVNPDHGTMADFEELVKTAHDNGMFVILDWVPNHTGWDHQWITAHPDYYTQNEAGEIVDPIKDDGTSWGWTDVADLNYDNMEMQNAMIEEMKFWITEQNVDVFRCDVAHGVPASFWEKAIPALRAEKDIFMLAEAEIPEIMTGDLFEMSYAWEGHHVLNSVAKGEHDVAHFDTYMKTYESRWEDDDILMNFVTNHDENAWAGPLWERMGDATEAMTALSYCMPGMPLIYSGQEYDMNRTLEFFKKDSIPKEKGVMWPLLSALGSLKNSYPALEGGKQAASYERLQTSEDQSVLAFRRNKDGKELIYIANLSDKAVTCKVPVNGVYQDALMGSEKEFVTDQSIQLEPWQYWILIN